MFFTIISHLFTSPGADQAGAHTEGCTLLQGHVYPGPGKLHRQPTSARHGEHAAYPPEPVQVGK